ncbi:MAG: Mfa1 family fimbria major subunit [Parabacteroides sp.]|nr:Mfa1 family fimbria major subunit [Parabacteroides sp.]
MKKRVLFITALSACFCVSCDKDLDTGNVNGSSSNDVAFVNISLNLPTNDGTTRALSKDGTGGNGNFFDGLPEEYQVKDAILVIFQGASEETAQFHQAINLGTDFVNNGTPDGPITSTYKTVLKVKKPTENNQLFGLAILNANNLFQVVPATDEDGLDKLQWKSPGSFEFTDFTGSYTSLQSSYNIASASIASAERGFLMLNAPQGTKEGDEPQDGQDVFTLVSMQYYDTEEAANNSSADPIYVERVVSKATVKLGNGAVDNTLTVNDGYYKGASVTFDGWKLNITNKSTFLLRKVEGWDTWKTYYNKDAASKENRFFGLTSNPVRVHWAVDTNYGSSKEDDFTIYSEQKQPDSWNSITDLKPEYCLENTTTAVDMDKNKLTSVLFKTVFTPKDTRPGDSFFVMGLNEAIYTTEQFVTSVNNVIYPNKITSDKISGNQGHTYKTADEISQWLSISQEDAQKLLDHHVFHDGIKYYKDGVTYYFATTIKHFGDYYTPYLGDKSHISYNENEHLGRFGMLRNNWYELVVRSVSGPGEPEIPTEPEEPVDKENAYINVSVNILPWTIRRQEVDL